MQIFVRSPFSTLTLDVDPGTTVKDVMELVHERDGTPRRARLIMTRGTPLPLQDTNRTLADFGIQPLATLTVSGCPLSCSPPAGEPQTADSGEQRLDLVRGSGCVVYAL
jgi:hypothetical protein